jgi:hypothetical protein
MTKRRRYHVEKVDPILPGEKERYLKIPLKDWEKAQREAKEPALMTPDELWNAIQTRDGISPVVTRELEKWLARLTAAPGLRFCDLSTAEQNILRWWKDGAIRMIKDREDRGETVKDEVITISKFEDAP